MPKQGYPQIFLGVAESTLKLRLSGSFAEAWELDFFPFDCQDLNVKIMFRPPGFAILAEEVNGLTFKHLRTTPMYANIPDVTWIERHRIK